MSPVRRDAAARGPEDGVIRPRAHALRAAVAPARWISAGSLAATAHLRAVVLVGRGDVDGGHRSRGSRGSIRDEPCDKQAANRCECHGKKHDDQRGPVGACPDELRCVNGDGHERVSSRTVGSSAEPSPLTPSPASAVGVATEGASCTEGAHAVTKETRGRSSTAQAGSPPPRRPALPGGRPGGRCVGVEGGRRRMVQRPADRVAVDVVEAVPGSDNPRHGDCGPDAHTCRSMTCGEVRGHRASRSFPARGRRFDPCLDRLTDLEEAYPDASVHRSLWENP